MSMLTAMPLAHLATPTATPKHSPKRKRGISDPAVVLPFAPRLDTTRADSPSSTETESHSAGANSPRTVVATQLSDLQIQPIPPPNFGGGGVTSAPAAKIRKRRAEEQSLGEEHYESEGLVDSDLDSTSECNGSILGRQRPHVRLRSPVPPKSIDGVTQDQPRDVTSADTEKAAPRARKVRSPPPRSHSPLPQSEDDTPSALTWHENEITGHLVDPRTDPEDDGYGINGIGFRPTPALAYARAQKRRQQVADWRAREAREARQKRTEKRRLGNSLSPNSASSGTESGHGSPQTLRAVRFA